MSARVIIASTFIDAIDASAVCEMHLAGYATNVTDGCEILIDHHGALVAESVWALDEHACQPAPTLIEWDPTFHRLRRCSMKRGELNRFEGAHMLSSRELQARFVDGLEGNDAALDELVVERGFSAAQRLKICRNNYNISLACALVAVYPTVENLVGAGFFSCLVHEFIRACPLRSGNLHDFGSELAHFLLRFKAAELLPFLSEVGVLEWRSHCDFHVADAPAFPLNSGQTFEAACQSVLATGANIDLNATLPALIGNERSAISAYWMTAIRATAIRTSIIPIRDGQ